MPDSAVTKVPSLRGARWFVRLVVLVFVCLAPTCVLLVDETELVLVQRFGRIVAVYDQPTEKGPHLKFPWPVETTLRFDRRLRLTVPAGRELFTRDRKNLIVEAYIGWKIPEPTAEEMADNFQRPVVKFYRSLGQPAVAESRLASRLQSLLTSRLGQMELSELIAVRDAEAKSSTDPTPLNLFAEALKRELKQRPGEAASLRDQLGIEIVEVGIKRINLPSGNLQAVYERMRSERQKIAERYRSAGMAESRKIRSQAERQATEILAQANAEAERIQASGEADALRILNEAHAADPELYETMQALETYRQLLSEQTTLVLSSSSRFWKLLTDGPPEISAQKVSPTETRAPAATEPKP